MTIPAILTHVREETPGDPVGVYLYGSAAAAGLRPDSDIDLLVLTRRSLTVAERRAWVALLLGISGWPGHADRFPEAARRRPVELTGLVLDDIRPWRRWPRRDFQYGEWLRDDLVNGDLPRPTGDPDIVILLATALTAHHALHGPDLTTLVAPVPPDLLRASVLAVIPDLVEGIEGDERNALLGLARVLVTLRTGRIVSKDAAAEAIAPTLDAAERELLEYARAGYLGLVADDWTEARSRAASLARTLAAQAKGHAP